MSRTHLLHFSRPPRAVRLADPGAAAAARALEESAAATAAAASRQAAADRQAVEEVLTGLAEAAAELARARSELLGEMQQAAVELATAIAVRVTYDQLQSDRFAIEELARAVVGRLPATGPVQVRLHPDDLAALQRRLGGGPLLESREIQCVADATLRRGDCAADAGEVSFAAHLEEQLAGLRRHLLRNLEDAQIERRQTAAGDRGLRRFPDRRQTA